MTVISLRAQCVLQLFSRNVSTGLICTSFLILYCPIRPNLVYPLVPLNTLISAEFRLITYFIITPQPSKMCNRFDDFVFSFLWDQPFAHFAGHLLPVHPPIIIILLTSACHPLPRLNSDSRYATPGRSASLIFTAVLV